MRLRCHSQMGCKATGNLVTVTVANAGVTVQNQNNRIDFEAMSQSLNVNGPLMAKRTKINHTINKTRTFSDGS